MITKTIKTAPHPWGRLRLWENGYLKALRAHIEQSITAQDSVDTINQIQVRAGKVFGTYIDSITDEASQHHYLMTSYVLASYYVLQDYIEDSTKVVEIIERSFSEPGAGWIKLMMRLALFVNRDKMKVVMAYGGKEKTKEVYGDKFVIEQKGGGRPFFSSNVKRCAYHDFFKANNATELTQVFCSWDRLWANEIKPQRDGIKFERPATLAAGDIECRFEFQRVEKM
ncbi:L-2-amino-thiazoline-4-carboxylic acid hydrolase [Reinekea sp.]|jgi:hypothetical protein|uniref:L-2-amino-thiazoline-4-carboxylic acid hydrolase n=1 Tax=Reinekea sp. TaxID=1970455 RepID=UPI002A7EB9B1|nr:L-2-amino-thiazoline-4-carboxylic acid hydrolase [Reinekea sp.]